VRVLRVVGILLFSAGIFFSGSAWPQQQDPSEAGSGDPVADAARRARAQRKDAPKPKKVITDDDIAAKPAPPTVPTAAPAANAEQAATTSGTNSKPAADGADNQPDRNPEAYWRKRFAAQRKKISDVEQEIDILQREAQKADLQYYSDPQKAMNEQFNRKEIKDKNDKIAAKKKELADLKQQLSDLEDELHRAGGDSGWTR
jgi:phage-related minor tail protein